MIGSRVEPIFCTGKKSFCTQTNNRQTALLINFFINKYLLLVKSNTRDHISTVDYLLNVEEHFSLN